LVVMRLSRYKPDTEWQLIPYLARLSGDRIKGAYVRAKT
jgi:hypothetical protein